MGKSSATSSNKIHGDLPSIGRRIRELRGLYVSQADFAKRVGATQSYLSALERGLKEPGAAVLLAISREFGKSVDWLLTGSAVLRPKRQRHDKMGERKSSEEE